MPRKTAFIGFSYFGGLLLASFLSLWLSFTLGGLFLCAGLCITLFIRPEKTGRFFRAGVCAAAAGTGLFLYSIYDVSVCTPTSAYDGCRFTSSAVITDSTVYSSDSAFYTAECKLPDGRSFRTGFYDTRTDLARGDSLTLTGVLYLPENTDFFNEKDFYASEGIYLLTERENSDNYIINENSFFHIADKFRNSVTDAIRRLGMSDSGELVIGMTFGNRYWNISEAREDLLYRSGIGHAAAVSGMHMAVIAAIVSNIAAALRFGTCARSLLTVTAASLFAVIAGMGNSVARSLIMIIIVCLSELLIRKNDPLTSLAIAVIIMTVPTPYVVRSTSFLLSLSGVIGTSVIAPEIISAAEKAMKDKLLFRIPYSKSLFSSIITVLCASAAVYPVSALTFDEISVISPVTNLLLSPLCTLAAGLGVTAAVLSLLPVTFISNTFFIASGLLCRLVLGVSEYTGNAPLSAIPAAADAALPMLIISAVICGLCTVLLNDRFYTVITLLSCWLICIITSAVYTSIPAENPGIAVLTEGKGCVVIVKDSDYSYVFDFTGNKKGLTAAKRHIRRTGAEEAAIVTLYGNPSGLEEYCKTSFPEAQIVSMSPHDSLTYCPQNYIIVFGEISLYNYGDYAVIDYKGTELICINRKSEPHDSGYDLAIYNCIADVRTDSEMSIITNRNYRGNVSADGRNTCRSCEYIITDNGLEIKEELTWLR